MRRYTHDKAPLTHAQRLAALEAARKQARAEIAAGEGPIAGGFLVQVPERGLDAATVIPCAPIAARPPFRGQTPSDRSAEREVCRQVIDGTPDPQIRRNVAALLRVARRGAL